MMNLQHLSEQIAIVQDALARHADDGDIRSLAEAIAAADEAANEIGLIEVGQSGYIHPAYREARQ